MGLCRERDRDRETQRQRDRGRDSNTEQQRLTGFKELAYVDIKAGKPKIYREDQQAGDSGKSICYNSSMKATCCRIPFCLEEVRLLSTQAFN